MTKYILLMLIIFNPLLLANDTKDGGSNEVDDDHYTLEIQYLIHDENNAQGKATDATFINFKDDPKNFTMDYLLNKLIYDIDSKVISCKNINKGFKNGNFHFQIYVRRIGLKTIYDASKDRAKIIQLKKCNELKSKKISLGKYADQIELSASKNQNLYKNVCTSLQNLNKCLDENSQTIVDDNTLIKHIPPTNLRPKFPLPIPQEQEINNH